MHANIYVLNKQLSAMALALFFAATTAGPGWAQDANRLQERPLLTTTLQQLNQPVLRSVGQQSVINTWTVAHSVIDTLVSGSPALLNEDSIPPTPLNGGGGSGGGTAGSPPDSEYDRVVQDLSAVGLAEVAQEQSQAAVLGNYPNPFNPQTTIRFEVRAAQQVRLVVFNALGQRVQVLVDGWVEAGAHEARFEAHNLPSGAYFSRLITEAGVVTRTMVLAR